MSHAPVVTLFTHAVRETREDVEEVASRLLVRVGDLAALASGALASQVDELGEFVSDRVDDVVGRVSAVVGDRVVGLGETLTGTARERD
ncbi:hypothetical protein [Pseudonocardia acaciae]|uniref:hypothetical protein n=1 Tax=Pseudonocardia acaciae TaxID=551276 RepID=UPI0012ECD900|nr:hypothetical protein [Pseudonocardia acaciae]